MDAWTRCETACDPDLVGAFDPALVQGAWSALNEIDDPEDRCASEDDLARALTAVGRPEDALRLVQDAPDDYHRLYRRLGMANGWLRRKETGAALECAVQALEEEERSGRMSGGFSDTLHADAALVFARAGAFDRALDMAAWLDRCNEYSAARFREVCELLIDAGDQAEAMRIVEWLPHFHQAVPVLIAIAGKHARFEPLDHAAKRLNEILSRSAADRLANPGRPYISDRNSIEYWSAQALNWIGSAYLRFGRVDPAVAAVERSIPPGADPNLFSLQADDSAQLAVGAISAGHPEAAHRLLDYARACAQSIPRHDQHGRAIALARLIVSNLAAGRPAAALELWTAIEGEQLDRGSLRSACIRIASSSCRLKTHIPDNLLAAISAALQSR